MTEKELHLALSDKINSAVEIARQAEAVRTFIEQDLLQQDDVQEEIVRLIGLLIRISKDVTELIWELNLLPEAGRETSAKAKQLLDELRKEVECCRELLNENPDLFVDAF